MYKEDLVLNNLQGLICHKNKSVKPETPLILQSAYIYNQSKHLVKFDRLNDCQAFKRIFPRSQAHLNFQMTIYNPI